MGGWHFLAVMRYGFQQVEEITGRQAPRDGCNSQRRRQVC